MTSTEFVHFQDGLLTCVKQDTTSLVSGVLTILDSGTRGIRWSNHNNNNNGETDGYAQ